MPKCIWGYLILSMFLSWKKYMGVEEEPEKDGLGARITHVLLNGIAQHAAEVNQLEYAEFRDSLLQLDKGLGEHPDGSQLLVATGSAIKTLEDYNRRATQFCRSQTAELK